MLVIMSVAVLLLILGWIYLVPHYNGKNYTFWIGTTYKPSEGFPMYEVEMERMRRVPEEHNPHQSKEPPRFISAPNFQGPMSGYVFKNDRLGLGYYVDQTPRHVRFAEANQVQNYSTAEPPNQVMMG
jgi:hypothetical protein